MSRFKLSATALAVAGLLWCLKASEILAIGYQPPLALELGQLMFPIGMIGLYLTCERPERLEKTSLGIALLGLIGSLLGLLYPLLPGAQISTGEQFVFPYSLFVLIGSAGGFVALLLFGIAILPNGTHWNRWRAMPFIVALLPIPLAATGLIHIEIPILTIGSTWVVLAYGLWQVGNSANAVPENSIATD